MSLEDAVRMLRRERVRGATWSARVAAETLVGLIESGVGRGEFVRACRMLRRATPSMGSVYNVTSLAEAEYASSGPQGALRLLRRFLKYQEECQRRIAEAWGSLFWEGVRVATLSYSSNVFRLLLKGKLYVSEVYVLESRPGAEGVRLAADLELNGLEVKLLPDSFMKHAVESADLVVVGADMVTVRRPTLVNKVGTSAIARLANALGKPVVAVFESYKIHPAITPSRVRLTKRAYHVRGYGVLRLPIFDRTPGNQISKALTEQGEISLDPRALRRVYDEFVESIKAG